MRLHCINSQEYMTYLYVALAHAWECFDMLAPATDTAYFFGLQSGNHKLCNVVIIRRATLYPSTSYAHGPTRVGTATAAVAVLATPMFQLCVCQLKHSIACSCMHAVRLVTHVVQRKDDARQELLVRKPLLSVQSTLQKPLTILMCHDYSLVLGWICAREV